jgi:hypothetical protein
VQVGLHTCVYILGPNVLVSRQDQRNEMAHPRTHRELKSGVTLKPSLFPQQSIPIFLHNQLSPQDQQKLLLQDQLMGSQRHVQKVKKSAKSGNI